MNNWPLEGRVVLHLSVRDTRTPPVPFELQTFITSEEWEGRIGEIIRMTARYSKTWLERAWTALALIAMFLLPTILYNIVFNAVVGTPSLQEEAFESGDQAILAGKLLDARMIGFAIFFGTVILFWTPLLIWKRIGRSRMQALLKRWAEGDTLARAAGVFVPMWSVQTPGIFDSRIILTVTTPPLPSGHSGSSQSNGGLPVYGYPGASYPIDEKVALPAAVVTTGV